MKKIKRHHGIAYVKLKRFRPINNEYRLVDDYSIQTELTNICVAKEFIELCHGGLLTIKEGFWWNGPSGPTFDSENFMRGSLVHDALYRLRRWKLLPYTARDYADELLYQICVEDGMTGFRAGYVHKGVHLGGIRSSLPGGG